MKRKLLSLTVVLALLLSGCGGEPTPTEPAGTGLSGAGVSDAADKVVIDPAELFTERDYSGEYGSNAVQIRLNGDSASCSKNSVRIEGGTVTVTEGGTYILSGVLENGTILVNAPKEDKVQLVLEGVEIRSETGAAIYVAQADKVFLTLAQGSENTLSNGGSFTATDDSNIDAVVFSKEDLTLNGTGSLTVTSPGGHGIASKDELTVTGGSYAISCASHGLSGSDSVCIAGGSFAVTAGKDGIHAEHTEDTTLGFVYIAGGNFTVTAEGDGISASGAMQLDGGSYAITTGGGSVNAQKQTSDGWGGMGGGGRPGGGMGGGMGGRSGSSSATTQEDSESIKGIKAGGDLAINGGSFTLDCADDALHSNGDLSVTGGSYTIATGDDGFHADGSLIITAGVIGITESYEGLEGLTIDISGGEIRLVSSDDGMNAAGGTDESGFGGFRGNDMFGGPGGMGGSADSYIRISGGDIYLQASGDGIDSNGTLEISGGSVTVCGPTRGDTAVLDYGLTGTLTGGTFIGTGSYMMAQSLTASDTQGVIALSVGNQSAGTQIKVQDGDGNLLLSHTPELDYAILILSCPEMVKGETYTVTVGSQSGDFEAG